ncbi:DUF7683 domain-containing protein [Pseudomonas lijiangensis]|uniref:DUF7683 domain-containing protein n=1 Tax=Pseudomonas lijiangensis TaxID=2995658 RepID=UPI003CCE6BA0
MPHGWTSRTLKFIIEAFDKENEFLDFEIVLPDDCEAQLAEIMNWSSPQRGIEGYNLSNTQLLASRCWQVSVSTTRNIYFN